jgi:hypothetical protein
LAVLPCRNESLASYAVIVSHVVENFNARTGEARTTPLFVSSAARAYFRRCESARGRRHVWSAARDGEADSVERLALDELWSFRAHWRRGRRSMMWED